MIDPFHVALAAVSLVFVFIVSTQFFTITSDVKLGVVTAADDTYKAMTRAFLLLTNACKIATMIGVFNIFNQLIFKGDPSAFAHSTLWGMTGTFCLLLFTISGFLTWTLASNKLEKHDDAIKYHTEKRIMSPTDKFAVLKDICHMASVACALAIENATSFSFGHDMESLWWYAVLLTLFSMGMVIFIGYFQSFFRRFFVRSLCCYKRGSTEAIFEETKRTTANMLVFLIVTMLTWSLGFAYTHAFKATVIAQGADTKTETCSDWACFLGLLVISLGVLHYQHAACRRDALKRKEDGIVHSPEIENNFGYTSFCYSVFCNSVLMYTTNFSLHDAVYQTVSHFSGGSREHATPNALIFAATVVAFTGGVVAYIVQKEATKIDDPSVTMTNFYDDCTKILVLGMSYSVGKLYYYGFTAKFDIDHENLLIGGAAGAHWMQPLYVAFYLTTAFSILAFLTSRVSLHFDKHLLKSTLIKSIDAALPASKPTPEAAAPADGSML